MLSAWDKGIEHVRIVNFVIFKGQRLRHVRLNIRYHVTTFSSFMLSLVLSFLCTFSYSKNSSEVRAQKILLEGEHPTFR